MDLMTTALNQALDYLGSLSPELQQESNRIRQTLEAPPRIVVVGRLKSGKSTLVNALIGAPVAETAALEATNVVTVFQYGAPDRAEAVLLDGQRLPITIQRGKAAELPAPAEKISYIHRWMPTASIRDFSLIDTPGLATLTVENEARTRRILIDGFEQTKAMSVDADAAVFLFDATPRMDEVKFIRDLGFTSLNTLGVLSRADSFGEGALGERDPLEHAYEHAQSLAQQLQGSVLTILPVAGLLAETSHTGAITEYDARAMASLANATEFDLIQKIASEEEFDRERDACRRIVKLIGEYGLFRARNVARRGASELNEWATARSGVPQLRNLLVTRFGEFATTHRAGRIVSEIESLAFRKQPKDLILNLVSTMRTDARLINAFLLLDLKAVQEADPKAKIIPEISVLIMGYTLQEKLGLPPTASMQEALSTAQEKMQWAHMESLSALTAAEDAALVTMKRAYGELIRMAQYHLQGR
ncbi:dynamin family protein [Corynebacterium freiburgense]|uniref:dynamin family protein n=1 Tax=Corynebacterium freiburgense TaxID=556548 RepID=UPI00041ACC99|nr:dynamin family protein [Corynebacterium freiburgense]WJZ01430.1 Isoniazid-induced protein IniC [Corynebacterium freiburgense]